MQFINIWVQISETIWKYKTGHFEITLERASNTQEEYWILKAEEVGIDYSVEFCHPMADLQFAKDQAILTTKRHLENCLHSL